jgi:hypothetical protein
MPNISNVQGNVPLLKKSYKKWLALGEKVTGNEFKMIIEDYPDLTYLISSTQLPMMQREMVEVYGPHGVKFMQQGRYVNAQDVPITFEEVITGKTLEAIREWVKNKRYLKVTLGLVSESQTTSNEFTTVVMEDCWIELEGVDLSKEDGAAAIKPSGTLHANWIGWLDDETATVSME